MNSKYSKDLVVDIETTGKFPWDGKIVCIGCKNCDGFETKIFFDRDEEKLIMEFIRFFNEHKFDRIVGYNVAHDYRFLVSKCLKYRIALRDFQFVKLIDVMKILKEAYHGYNYNKPGTLDEWSTFLVGRGKLRINKSVKELLSENRIDEIRQYNQTDVELCFKLYERINQVMVVR
jgi:DNA polymerase elongation subunit (family B)